MVSRPPAIRPTAPPATLIAAYTPIARFRGGPSGKVVAISASAAAAIDRGAGTLDGAGREQPRLGGGEPASQRSRREQQQPGDEHLAAAEQVPGPARQQQQPAEGQRVGVDHPFQAGAGKAERPLDVRQRHVDDGRVQHHHQLRGRDDEQGQAEAGTGCPGPRGTRGSRPPGYGSCLRHEGFSWWVRARYFLAVREAPLACGHLARYEGGPWQGVTRWGAWGWNLRVAARGTTVRRIGSASSRASVSTVEVASPASTADTPGPVPTQRAGDLAARNAALPARLVGFPAAAIAG